MRRIIDKTWKPLMALAVITVVVRVLLGGGGPTHVKGTISRFSSIQYVPGTGLDALLREHGVDPSANGARFGVAKDTGQQAVTADSADVFGLSPTCGCEAARAEKWRGVTFASTQVTIRRHGRSPLTEWLVEPSVPGIIAMDNSEDRVFPVEVYRYAQGDRPRRIAEFASVRLPIVSSSAAEIYLRSPVPIGAWIPYPGSTVTIRSAVNPELRNPRVVLNERYPQTVGINRGASAGYAQGYPLGEFLMPSAIAYTGGNTEVPGFVKPATADQVTIFVPRDSYAFRVAVIPLSLDERRNFERYAQERHPLLTPLGVLTGRQAWIGQPDGGHVTVTIHNPLAGAAYGRSRARAQATPRKTFRVLVLPRRFTRMTSGRMTLDTTQFKLGRQAFEYPPMPPSAGVNIFGQMRDLRLLNAEGAISVDGRNVDMPVPSDLEMTDIHHLGTVEGHQLVPFSTGPQNSTAQFDFAGVAEVKVDGASQTSFFKRRKTLINGLVVGIGFLAAVTALLEMAFRRRKSDLRPLARRR